jgi:hypothetical protein
VREAWLEVERVPAMPDLAAAADRTDWSG